MTLSKAQASRRDLERRRDEAARAGNHFGVRYSLGGKPHDPPRFFATLDTAKVEAAALFARLNTANGPDVHARPDDMKSVDVWVEHLVDGAWVKINGSPWRGHLDTAK